jgi:long-chain acyl-CoA synthetase
MDKTELTTREIPEGETQRTYFLRHTIPQLLKLQCERWDNKIALRRKEYGIWREHTWNDWWQCVKYFALGLLSLGFKQGDRVCIIGETTPEWLFAEFGTMAAGGVPVGIYQDCLPEEIKFFAEHSEATVIVAEDQEQIDKVLEIKAESPRLLKAIYWDPKGLRSYDDPLLISFDRFLEQGRLHEKEHPGLFDAILAKGQPDDIAQLFYTSGTTANPKGVMETHRVLLNIALNFQERYPVRPGDNLFPFASFAWALDLPTFVIPAIIKGSTLNFYEEPETVSEDLREIGPDSLFVPPRILEAQLSQVQVDLLDSTFLKRFIYRLFEPVGYKLLELKSGDSAVRKQSSLLWRILGYLAYVVAFRPILDRLGYKNARIVIVAGTFTGPDTMKYFRAIGVPLVNAYGLTEILGTHGHTLDDVRNETVGICQANQEARISESGEVLLRGTNRSIGYYANPEATKKLIDEAGWVHTGDAGYINGDGHLTIIDRVSDLMKSIDGSPFSPTYLENKLKFTPYLRDAIIVGDNMPFISAIAVIDFITVSKWAEKQGIEFTSYVDLSQKPEVYELVTKAVKDINKSLPNHLRINRFAILHKELDADDAELTRTRKVRRDFVAKRYAGLITALQSEEQKPEYEVTADVRYRDGRTGVVKTSVKVVTLEEAKK